MCYETVKKYKFALWTYLFSLNSTQSSYLWHFDYVPFYQKPLLVPCSVFSFVRLFSQRLVVKYDKRKLTKATEEVLQ